MGTAGLGCCEYNNIFSEKTQGFTKRQIYFLRFFSYPHCRKEKGKPHFTAIRLCRNISCLCDKRQSYNAGIIGHIVRLCILTIKKINSMTVFPPYSRGFLPHIILFYFLFLLVTQSIDTVRKDR